MKTNLLILLLLTLTFGCATRNIKYNQYKIIKKYATKYKIFVDGEKVDLRNVFLDIDNIKNVRIDRPNREVKITQIKPAELVSINKLKLDSLYPDGKNERKISLIIIDGIPLLDSLKTIKIDVNAIKKLTILTEEKLNETTLCNSVHGDWLLITTKNKRTKQNH